jgi:hypothetical protein
MSKTPADRTMTTPRVTRNVSVSLLKTDLMLLTVGNVPGSVTAHTMTITIRMMTPP